MAQLMSLITELKRRNVFRAGGAYLIAVWIVLQVTDVVAPALGLPGWVLTAEIVLAIIGLPIALFMAWAYDLTSSGLRKAEEVPIGELAALPAGPARWAELAVFVILLVAVAYLLTDKLFLTETSAVRLPDGRRSIAVLPFENFSTDPDQQYFADGIAEEILNSLAAVRELRVTSRTSSFALRDSSTSVSEVGRRLNADYIVEGSVRRSESTVRITAQLIRADVDTHLWSDTYDRPLRAADILEVQETIARTIADRLQARVLPDDPSKANPPKNFAALDAYLDGRTYLRDLQTGTADYSDTFFRNAIERMEASVQEDPNWAPSRQALGAIWHFWFSSDMDQSQFEQRWQKSREQIQKALSIDPDYQPAWISLAFLHLQKGDFSASLDALEHVADSKARGHWITGMLMAALADYEAATEHYDEARALDPLSVAIREQRATILSCTGRYEEASRELESVMATAANSGEPLSYLMPDLAYAYAKSGNVDKALELAADYAAAGGPKTSMAFIYGIAGMTDVAASLLTELENSEDFLVWSYVTTAVSIGQVDRAWDQLSRIAEQSPESLWYFPCTEESRSLKGDPRFAELLAAAGIPEAFR